MASGAGSSSWSVAWACVVARPQVRRSNTEGCGRWRAAAAVTEMLRRSVYPRGERSLTLRSSGHSGAGAPCTAALHLRASPHTTSPDQNSILTSCFADEEKLTFLLILSHSGWQPQQRNRRAQHCGTGLAARDGTGHLDTVTSSAAAVANHRQQTPPLWPCPCPTQHCLWMHACVHAQLRRGLAEHLGRLLADALSKGDSCDGG